MFNIILGFINLGLLFYNIQVDNPLWVIIFCGFASLYCFVLGILQINKIK